MKCPACKKEVYHAERIPSAGADWHKGCLKCNKCGKLLEPGVYTSHEGMPYCHKPCYRDLYGPSGYGRGGSGQKHVY